MTLNRKTLMEMMIADEGERLDPYKCTAGKLTIGVGRNLDDNGISHDEAMYMLNNDLDRCEADCEHAFAFWDALTEGRKMVLINMRFNLGLDGLLQFKRTLNAIAAGKYYEAAAYMLDSKWSQQVGNRAVRLSKIMATGIMTD